MKESGINYFYSNLGMDTGAFAVYYTFEDNAGTNVASVSGGQSGYSGTLNSAAGFWTSPGSGHFSGTTLTINNASGLDSPGWTKVFSYEKTSVEPCILFDSLSGSSGCRIGITKANKPYFQTYNTEPVVATSLNNYSSKNVVSFTYLTNYLTIGLYNWNTQLVEAETFTYPFQWSRSDVQTLGAGQFTGYMDTYIHLTSPLNTSAQSQLFSGLFAYPTGTLIPVTSQCVTGITGYQSVFVFTTGITGYGAVPGGDIGQGYYTGQFPTTYTEIIYTGYLTTGLYNSGVSGVVCYPTTGTPVTLYLYQSGYAASFGMEKIQYFSYLESGSTVKNSVDYTPWNPIYNIIGLRQYSGYLADPTYTTGLLDLYWNGVALAGSGWSISGSYILITGTQSSDASFWDLKNGDKKTFNITGGLVTFPFTYSGQELYVNGVNLTSGDFTQNGVSVTLIGAATGFGGVISEYPIVLTPTTGRYTLWTGARFWRDTSNVYINGIRQQEDSLYTEGAIYDKLSGNFFNPAICQPLYSDTDLYWD